MGAWGTGISSNDTYADIYEQFIDLYNEGLSPSEITERLIAENQETIDLPEDSTNFWFALANGQWECKALDNEIYNRVEHIIKNGEDLAVWKELEASSSDLKAREKILNKFLEKLQTTKEKPRKRVKKKFYNSIFKKGDCLTYLMDNGNYGGAFVLTDENQTVAGTNYIAITTFDKAIKPTIEDFKSANVYMKHVNEISFEKTDLKQNWIDKPQIGAFSAIQFKKNDIDIEVIGQLKIYKEYEINKNRYLGFSWTALKWLIPFKDEYIKINGITKTKLKLSKWTKKHWL